MFVSQFFNTRPRLCILLLFGSFTVWWLSTCTLLCVESFWSRLKEKYAEGGPRYFTWATANSEALIILWTIIASLYLLLCFVS